MEYAPLLLPSREGKLPNTASVLRDRIYPVQAVQAAHIEPRNKRRTSNEPRGPTISKDSSRLIEHGAGTKPDCQNQVYPLSLLVHPLLCSGLL